MKARLQPASLRSARQSPKDCHDNSGQEVCGLECPAPDEVHAYTEDEHGPYEREVSSAPAVMMGWIKRASRVIVPWNTPTGKAEKMAPRPIEAVMAHTMMQSRAP